MNASKVKVSIEFFPPKDMEKFLSVDYRQTHDEANRN